MCPVLQLTASGAMADLFALCFGSVEGGGALLLGEAPLPAALELHYTPMLASPMHPHYYVVHLDKISVAGADIDIPPVLQLPWPCAHRESHGSANPDPFIYPLCVVTE